VLYAGPPSRLRSFLKDLGYPLPDYMDLADFAAQFVNSPSTAWETLRTDSCKAQKPLTSPAELARQWTQRTRVQAAEDAPHQRRTLALNISFLQGMYGTQASHSAFSRFRLLFARQKLLLMRNTPMVVSRTLQSAIMGTVVGSVYLKIDPSNFVSFVSVSLFASIYLAFSNMPEVC
jgi:hypothetical protein